MSKQFLKLEEKLKNSLTPQYSWLFMHIGRLERGVKFLVDLRTDVLVSAYPIMLQSNKISSLPAFLCY